MSAPAPLPPPGGNVDRAPALLACIWTPVPFTIFLLGARLYIRVRMRAVGIEDYLMVACWILYMVSFSIETANINTGGARHVFYLMSDPDNIIKIAKLTWICQPIAVMSSAFGKCSVAFLIRRFIGPNSTWRRWALDINAALYMLTSILASILSWVQCNHVSALWHDVAGDKCWNPSILGDFDTFQSSYGTFLDFFLALLPASIIWGLKMSLKKRIATCLLLGLGVFAGICAAIKTSLLENITAIKDPTWNEFGIWVWTSLEISLVIICGCIPTLKPLYDQVVKSPVFSTYGKGTKNSYDSSNMDSFANTKVSNASSSWPLHKDRLASEADLPRASNTNMSYNNEEEYAMQPVEPRRIGSPDPESGRNMAPERTYR